MSTYVKVECVNPRGRSQATVCLEDISLIGPLENGVILDNPSTTGTNVKVRVVAMKNGCSFAVEPWIAEKLEARLLEKSAGFGDRLLDAPIRDVCACACERCKLFPHPHSIYHLDCCGTTARHRSAQVPKSATKELDEACAVCGSRVFETPSGFVCVDGHGSQGIIP